MLACTAVNNTFKKNNTTRLTEKDYGNKKSNEKYEALFVI